MNNDRSLTMDFGSAYRKFMNFFMLTMCVVSALLAVLILGLVLYFLLSRGFGALNLHFFTELPNHIDEKKGGMAQSIFGTLVLLGIASALGLPLGILGGIYQVEAKGYFASCVRFFTDVLNGIPSIVIGIFVYAVAVYPVSQKHAGQGFSAWAGGLALGIMMIPTIMRTTEEILKLVPFSMREASLGLGATRWRTMWSVVLPAAKGGIITGIMLALARIAGETAPLLFTILGNEFYATKSVKLFGHMFHLPDLSQPIDSLPKRIYEYSMSVDPVQNQLAWAGAVVLITIVLLFSIAARFATRSKLLEEK